MADLEIICLANSIKHGGRCVAGLRLDGGGWVRPVSRSGDGSLARRHYTLADRTPAQVLDVLRMKLVERSPKPHQPENWVIQPIPWLLKSRPAPSTFRTIRLLESGLVHGPELLGSSTDRVAYAEFSKSPASSSLALVQPQNLRWVVRKYADDKRPRALFRLGGQEYDLPLTDPVWRDRLKSLSVGKHASEEIGLGREEEILLTISIGEPFSPTPDAPETCFKLVAAVIVLPDSWKGRI